MVYYPEYDSQGRPLNADPNYCSGVFRIEGKEYTVVRRGWKVRIYEGNTDYMAMLHDHEYIAEIDLTPDYLKD